MKNDCLNVCKGVAAFFVVFIHCNFPSPVGGMMNGLARFAVPLFFMISGYFSYQKRIDVIRSRTRKIWRLFLLSNSVYFIWKVAVSWWEETLSWGMMADLFSPISLMRWIFLNQSPMMSHLWFLGALLYCYLFYGFLIGHIKEEYFYFLIPVCLVCNLFLGNKISFMYVRNFWLTGLPFFLWGHWFAREESCKRLRFKGRYCIVAVGAGACLTMAEMLLLGGKELYLGSVLMAAGGFAWALEHPHFGENSRMAHIGERDALHIYLWQMIVYDITIITASHKGFEGHMVYQWLMPLWVCLISWLLAEGIERAKKSGIYKKFY